MIQSHLITCQHTGSDARLDDDVLLSGEGQVEHIEAPQHVRPRLEEEETQHRRWDVERRHYAGHEHEVHAHAAEDGAEQHADHHRSHGDLLGPCPDWLSFEGELRRYALAWKIADTHRLHACALSSLKKITSSSLCLSIRERLIWVGMCS